MDVNECERHEMIGCTLCSGKETTLLPPDKALDRIDLAIDPAIKALKAPKPGVDPVVRLAGEIASGYRCGACLEPTTGIGCLCSRDIVYGDDMAAAADFLVPAIAETMLEQALGHVPTIKAKAFQGIGTAVQRRAMRRVGHLGEKELTEQRVGLKAELGIDPSKAKWHAPRTTEADVLPV